MKSLKIKAYSLKKTSSLEKKILQSATEKLHKAKQIQNNNGIISEIEKIIKSPSLNISSKVDSKGSQSININVSEKNKLSNIDIKNNENQSTKQNKESTQNLHSKESEKQTLSEAKEKLINNSSNIKIKFNINSEVINNNYKISGKNLFENNSPRGKQENKNNEYPNEKSVNYYKEQLNYRDSTIEKLSNELEQAKIIISKLISEKKSIDFSVDDKNIKEFIETKNNTFVAKGNKNNYFNERETKESIPQSNNNQKTEENEKIKFTIQKDQSKNLVNNEFRKSNRINKTSNCIKENNNYFLKQGKSIEEVLKSTVKLIENNSNLGVNSRNKENFFKTEECLKKIKSRTQGLLENFSQSLITMSTSKIKNSSN